ncbi:MAG: hypothetical protein GTO18_05615 [Anaerolineales bacterium]|nr:hypothetical protein [Anaerolineales bacterium]
MSCGEYLERVLRQEGYRVTPQRAVILETIAHLEGHSSAQEVHHLARERLPGLNVATVYRTLDTLQRAGLIDLLSTRDDSMRFALKDEANQHGHLHCVKCGLVLEVEMKPFQRMSESIERVHGFHADMDHFTLRGICQHCHDASDRVQG